jgi:hypothetical protein
MTPLDKAFDEPDDSANEDVNEVDKPAIPESGSEQVDDQFAEDESISFRPDIASLNSYKTQGYKEWWALAEFVDNSISSFITNKDALITQEGPEFVLDIELILDEPGGFIEIRDNAAGIQKTDFPRAFRTGTPPANKSSLSQFGLGMKAAGIWFANLVTVRSSALGEELMRTVSIDLDLINSTGQEDYFPKLTKVGLEVHGTVVKLSRLSRDVPVDRHTLQTIREYLSSIYRDFIRTGEVRIVVEARKSSGGTEITELNFEPPSFLVAPRVPEADQAPNAADVLEHKWFKELDFTLESGKRVRGWAGLRDKGSYQNNGLILLWHRKVIKGAGTGKDIKAGDSVYKPSVVFGAQNSAVSLRLLGELDMSEFATTNRKDDLTWSNAEEIEFLTKLKRELDAKPIDLLRQAVKFKVAEKTVEVVEEWRKSLDEVAGHSEVVLDNFPDSDAELAVDENLIDEGFLDDEIDLVAEYEVRLQGEQLPIKVSLGFISDAELPTFIVRSAQDLNLVLINRESPFSKAFGDPRLNDLKGFTRILISLGIAEIYSRKILGLRMTGVLRRTFNQILDSDRMTDIGYES